jgi:HSP20 family protein
MVRLDSFCDRLPIGDLVSRAFPESLRAAALPQRSRPWPPPVDVWETEDALVVTMDVAGVDRDEIDIEVAADSLTVRGVRPASSPAGTEQVLRGERAVGGFERSFTLSVPAVPDQASAGFHDGVLTITTPRALPFAIGGSGSRASAHWG